MIDRFGTGILGGDGNIDRPAVAAIVFGDPEALADLNAITHPAIGVAMMQRKDEFAATDDIVILDIPLLKEVHRQMLSLAAVVVVDTPMETALDRLITIRGMSKEDAEARIASQIDRQTRLQGADLVVDNSGDEQHLAEEVARIWDALVVLRNEANP
jgi:dephospho-CoA kinase